MTALSLLIVLSSSPLIEQNVRERILNAQENDTQERKNQKLEVMTLAIQNHLKTVIFDQSLTEVIDGIGAGNFKLSNLKNCAIELDDSKDYYWTALQVTGKESAIYTSTATDVVLILQNYGEQLFEGSRLQDLRTSYFKIVGIRRYKTLVGSKQAFVIEPSW